jgi:[ribosomal protein S5]-alanine N-acetyltransferase
LLVLDTVFHTFPVLETERFQLRELHEADSQDMFSYFSQDIVTIYYDLDTFKTIDEAVSLIERFLNNYKNKKSICWGISLKDTGRLIGTCGFHNIEKGNGKLEIGYELHPDFWGKGIMTEVATAVIKFGFETMEANRIEAFYDPENNASKNLLKKLGFSYEGTLRSRFFEKGVFVDASLSALLRDEFND